MKCMNCVNYKICKSLNNTGIFAKFPELDDCSLFESNPEHEVKEGEKKKKNATSSSNRFTSYPCRSRI